MTQFGEGRLGRIGRRLDVTNSEFIGLRSPGPAAQGNEAVTLRMHNTDNGDGPSADEPEGPACA